MAREAGVANYAACPFGNAETELRQSRAAGAAMLCWGEAGYPARLTEIPDPPPILWLKGDSKLLSKRMIALVGARNASSLGTRMAKRLAADLSEAGFVVVSGLARGVDTAAHFGALESGTVAVQAGGVDVIYPAENARLGEDIAKSGLRLSEQPMALVPQARHFPPRNRIISGLSEAVVVVEAAAKSGSLITARNALDQGREILAVPGHPFDARASGCNMLIRDGAALVRGLDDILEALAPLAPAPDATREQPHLIPEVRPEPRGLAETVRAAQSDPVAPRAEPGGRRPAHPRSRRTRGPRHTRNRHA